MQTGSSSRQPNNDSKNNNSGGRNEACCDAFIELHAVVLFCRAVRTARVTQAKIASKEDPERSTSIVLPFPRLAFGLHPFAWVFWSAFNPREDA